MARCIASLLVASVGLFLGACTLEPHYHRPPAPVPALPGGTAGGTAAADIGWREFFPDPQLQQLIALALTDNRDMRVAVGSLLGRGDRGGRLSGAAGEATRDGLMGGNLWFFGATADGALEASSDPLGRVDANLAVLGGFER